MRILSIILSILPAAATAWVVARPVPPAQGSVSAVPPAGAIKGADRGDNHFTKE